MSPPDHICAMLTGGEGAAPVKPPAANNTSNAAAKKAANGLSVLWSKAPAQKAPAADPVPAQAAGDAEAALRAAQEVRSCRGMQCFQVLSDTCGSFLLSHSAL